MEILIRRSPRKWLLREGPSCCDARGEMKSVWFQGETIRNSDKFHGARHSRCALFIDRETPVTRSTLSYPLKLRARGRASRPRASAVFLQIKDQAAPIRKRRYVNWYSRSRVLRFRINLLENDRHRRRHLAARALAHSNYGRRGRNLLHLVRLNIVTKRGRGREYLGRSTDCSRRVHGESKRFTIDPLWPFHFRDPEERIRDKRQGNVLENS